MIQTSNCPSSDRWQALLADPSSSDSGELESHLAGCTRCQAVLDDIAVGSSGWLRDANRLATKTDSDPEMTKTLHRLREALAEEPAPEVSLHFLTPSDQPGVLGTLGRYQVLEVIGRGAFGIVLKALDPDLLRPVAIKVLAPYLAPSGTARQRFLREARAAAAVIHDNVINVHAVEIAGDVPYIVMEFVTGISLQGRLDRDGPLPPRDIARIGHQAASGLAAAHAQGLVHRDIKPANILLENGVERVKITDFGLARAADDARLTQSGVTAGTPLYMSPEQALGDAIDHRSDLFSLGSVLYTLATGFPPFRADSTMGVLNRISNQPPRPIRETNPDFPPALEKIIMQLLEKDPAKRFQLAADVSFKLTGFLSGPETTPSTDDDETKPTKWWVTALCIVAGIAMVVVVLTFKTAKGTLVVEVDDPDVKVALDGEELTILGAGPQEVRLKPGTYRVSASKDGKPAKVSQELVTISKFGKQIVKVTFDANETPPWTAGFDDVKAGPPLFEARLNAVFPKADPERVLLIRIAWRQSQEKSASVRPTGDVPNPQTHPLFPELKGRAVEMAKDNLDPGDVRHVVDSAYTLAGKILDGKHLWARTGDMADASVDEVLTARIRNVLPDADLERLELMLYAWKEAKSGALIAHVAKDGPVPQTHPEYARLKAFMLGAQKTDIEAEQIKKILNEAYTLAGKILADTATSTSLMGGRKKKDFAWSTKIDELAKKFEDLAKRIGDTPAAALFIFPGPITDYDKAVATINTKHRDNVKKLLVLRDQFALTLPKAQAFASRLEDAKQLVASSLRMSLEQSLDAHYAALTGELREMETLAVALGAKPAGQGDPFGRVDGWETRQKTTIKEFQARIAAIAKTRTGQPLLTAGPNADPDKVTAGMMTRDANRVKQLLSIRDRFEAMIPKAQRELERWEKATVEFKSADANYKAKTIPNREWEQAKLELAQAERALTTTEDAMAQLLADLDQIAKGMGVAGKSGEDLAAEFKKVMAEYDAIILRLAKTSVGRLLATIRVDRGWGDKDLQVTLGADQAKIELGRKLLTLRDQIYQQSREAEISLNERANRLESKATAKEHELPALIDELIRKNEQDIRFRTATIRGLVDDLKVLADEIDPLVKKGPG